MSYLPENLAEHIRENGGLVVDGLPEADYFASPGVSNSELKLFAEKSPAHYIHAKKKERLETKQMAIGKMVHTLVLEPGEFLNRYFLFEKIDRRSNAGKAAYAEQELRAGNRVRVDAEQIEQARAMADAIKNHPAAAKLLSGGKAERSAFWIDEETGLLCRCRADYQKPGFIVDLKTTADASRDQWQRQLHNFRYHVQDAFYTSGFRRVGEQVEHFAFVVVETEAPHAVAVYVLDAESAIEGERIMSRDLRNFAACKSSNTWPGYSDRVQTISLPPWGFSKTDENGETTE